MYTGTTSSFEWTTKVCLNVDKMVASVAFAQDLPALAQPTCSTEDDKRSRQERMRDDAATVKAARERPVSTSGPDTGRACPEPKAFEQKTFRVGNGVLVGRDMGRVGGVICSAHDGQPERLQTCLPPSDLVLVESVRGMWMAS